MNDSPKLDVAPLLWKGSRLLTRFRWHANVWATSHPAVLDFIGAQITVLDAFSAPGDALLTGIVCRNLARRFPRLRINCITPHPMLLEGAPYIRSLNSPETFFMIWSSYPALSERRDGESNALKLIFQSLGITDYEYKAAVHLAPNELSAARARLGSDPRPILAFNMLSKEAVKNWPLERWTALLNRLQHEFRLVHLGDDREPIYPHAERFAGRLSFRESMAVLAHAHIHVGPDSFLMHAANGVNVPSVIIFGGSRTPANFGYDGNINLHVKIACGPCYIQTSLGGSCPHKIACMDLISPDEVYKAVQKLCAAREVHLAA